MSRAWLATIFLSRAFSASSSLSRFHAAVLGHPAMPGRLGDLQMTAHLVEFLTLRQQLVALGELADDLIRRVPPALLRCHVVADSSCPEHRATESHNNLTNRSGSGQRDYL
jgi:hypothetical protein